MEILSAEAFGCDAARFLDVSFCMGQGDEAGFELGRGEVDSGVQGCVEEAGEGCPIATLRVCEVDYGAGRKKEAKHGTHPMECHFQLLPLERCAYAFF